MHLTFSNVNDAFACFVHKIHSGQIPTSRSPSRVGETLTIEEPVTITYENPREKVLFNYNRDCNPFFHLYEALWMLAGRNNLAPLQYYNSRFGDFSDDGKTLHGAYGYRWRKYFGYDQLSWIVDELKANPASRRVVLTMWDGGQTRTDYTKGDIEYNPPSAREGSGDFYVATHGGKDVPCNTHAMFRIIDNELVMTVCNRSNDLVWGTLGANVVHFAFLQEYLAACIGVPVGPYHQFTNNLHVYTDRWQPEFWLADEEVDLYNAHLNPFHDADIELEADVHSGLVPYPLAHTDNEAALLDRELYAFTNCMGSLETAQQHTLTVWDTPYLEFVAKPMCLAFMFYKQRLFKSALEYASQCQSMDWRYVATKWIKKREAKAL